MARIGTEQPGRTEAGDVSGGEREGRYLLAGISVAIIWVSIGIAGIASPDMITGSEREHIPVVAFTDWLWAGLATALVMLAVSRRSPGASRSLWMGMTIAIAGIWLTVAAVSVLGPEMVTGSDPTRIPIAAMIAPIAGSIATAFVSVFVAGSPDRTGS